MPRKGHIAKRDVLADPIYNNKVVTKLINNIMLDGKKGVAQKIVYGAFDRIAEETGKPALEVFEEAMNNIMPLLEVKARRIGGATYHWGGDVLIPDLELEDGSNYQIGKYGRMRQRYLFENYHAMYTHLVLTEKLWKHLEEVDMEYNDMMDMLTVRMAERESVTEHLKSVDQLGWVRKMNNIRSRAEEVVLHDLIYR